MSYKMKKVVGQYDSGVMYLRREHFNKPLRRSQI